MDYMEFKKNNCDVLPNARAKIVAEFENHLRMFFNPAYNFNTLPCDDPINGSVGIIVFKVKDLTETAFNIELPIAEKAVSRKHTSRKDFDNAFSKGIIYLTT